ncbi:sensor histidine kinase [Desulfovermiculus halophilus]|uniref:sensor histidine kinase n=1 Tax=Desulfovermiculus halophilus TaxID=339722 RepID=UPI000552C847|nr:ATP-binding protein [Desulfovermiculus halophilus]
MHLSLRQRIFALITSMGLITVVCGCAILWYTRYIDDAVNTVVQQEVKAFRAVQEMQVALLRQKEIETTSRVVGEQKQLRELGTYRQIFLGSLQQAAELAQTPEQKRMLGLIESAYTRYIELKDRDLQQYPPQGGGQDSSGLRTDQRALFLEVQNKCETYKQMQWNHIREARQESETRTESLRIIAVFAICCFVLLSGFLALILYRQILDPIRQLAYETGGKNREDEHNEVQSLSSSLHRFLEDFDFAHNELTRSREHLEQAEKMALVGKLAAGMAHTIRNPFTSIKMRLFSLSRSLDLSENDKEDFDVISGEITRIDNIVQNFLEFARPPKLKMQECRIQDIVQSALQLLKHRLQSHNVQVHFHPGKDIPLVWADPEQLKEALINLIINAYESMTGGGWIEITLKTRKTDESNQTAVIWIQDNGEGISAAIQDRVMQPFYTTKEDGTGLGLSIVTRIVEEHGGSMQFVSRPGQGTTFEIALPAKEDSHEQNSDH